MRRTAALVVALVASQAVGAQSPAELFVHRAVPNLSAPANGAITSHVEVGVRLPSLFTAAGSAAPQVVLNLGAHRWVASFERIDIDAAGFRSWAGHVVPQPDSHVVFTERDGVVSGLINAFGVTYQLRTQAPDVHILEQIDVSRLRDEAVPIAANVDFSPFAGSTPDDGSTIDVLMLYTPAARVARGGTAQIAALASQVISDTNTALARSAIPTRVRLIATLEFARAEAPKMTNDLVALRDSTEAQLLRNAARADLVQLLVSSPDQSACGVGLQLTALGDTDFQAFSVADVACAAQYTPTHEMGHNLGSQHAPEDAGGPGLFPYSHGFKDPEGGFRTVMAYSCPTASCPRIPNFSNPRVAESGRPTGSASQDNARSISEAAFSVANFRASTNAGVSPPEPPGNLRATVVGAAVTVEWSSAGSATAPTQAPVYILQVGTAPDRADLLNVSMGTTASASGVLPSGTFFWRVIAVNDDGASTPSPAAQFSVPGCPLPAPPTNLAVDVTGATVTLTWTPSATTPSPLYVLEAGTGAALADIVRVAVGTQPSFATPAPPGRYYVRIRAHNACGTSGPSNEQIVVVP